mmetsp:Transcript_20066/g.55778  ORF Transcript_20066/g.55778 Transcript_20066/m.55778 type:complete len:339 (+) Transcript_20066:902-1918(+)
MRSYEARSMTGPISPGPLPALILEAADTIFCTSASPAETESPSPLPSLRSWLSSTVRRTEAAMHLCPAQPAKLTVMSAAAPSASQSSRATRWFLAPPRAVQRLGSARARQRWDTILATGEDPTKVTAWTSVWSTRASTQALVPWTMLKTPSGRPAFRNRSAAYLMVSGTFSLGLRTTAFPMTRAMGTVHMGTMKGKLNGTMAATTPSGSLRSVQDTWPETRSVFPTASCGSEQAHSTVSFPLATSARASVMFLPFSWTMSSASSRACSWTRAWNFIRTAARCLMVRDDHDGKAFLAEATASSTSQAAERATLPMVLESAGLMTSMYSLVEGGTKPPQM